MKQLFTVAAILASLGLSAGNAWASNTGWVTIQQLWTLENGVMVVKPSIADRMDAMPSCIDMGNGARFAFNASTPAGQTMAAAILSAFAQRKRVWFVGNGQCTLNTGDENAVLLSFEG